MTTSGIEERGRVYGTPFHKSTSSLSATLTSVHPSDSITDCTWGCPDLGQQASAQPPLHHLPARSQRQSGRNKERMSFTKALKCKECHREYPLEPVNVCEFCFGPLEVAYDYEAIGRRLSRQSIQKGPLSLWRYKELLPVNSENVVDINAGFTPLIKAGNLGKHLGLDNLYLKNDCVNPSYSFKDRVVSVAATKALEFGFTTLACASTGNLACAVAAHAAKAGIKAYVFIPADLEQGKILGAAIYGPTIVAVQGNYDEVNRLCSELADSYRWAFVNINVRPYYAEGSKTLGYEVAEQLGWRAPDHCVVPVASGSLLTKIWKGMQEFSQLGIIGPVKTKMHAAQATGCSPIVTAFKEGASFIKPVKPRTIAKSLAIGNPADGIYALDTVRTTGGRGVDVSDEEVIAGIKLLAETEGIFAETAGGVVVASLKHLVKQGAIKPDDLAVAYITGNGLKTQEAVADVVKPLFIQPTVESFQQALKGR
ncbi:MAG: threonine synthase [Chloroflexi bacterium]|nr:threonine synthase [Chloroflexota bacterium]